MFREEENVSPEEIRALRERLGLTQKALADRLGVHPRTYQQWELGRRQPNAAAIKLLEMIGREAKGERE